MEPLCFLILINDALSDTPHRWKYVNDYTMGVIVDNTSPNYSSLQGTLGNLHAWTMENKVTININKTVVIHFSTAITPVQTPTITVGAFPLQLV